MPPASSSPDSEVPRVLMLFVDGVGLGDPDPAINPIFRGDSPCLARWLSERARPVDARLGVNGAPQSATGQAALFTGRNAAAFMGRHVEGLPGPRLREFVERDNIFLRCVAAGLPSTFANGFGMPAGGPPRLRRRPSVSTVAVLSAFGDVRRIDALLENRAVCHDLTREALRPFGYEGPFIDPRAAAGHLTSIAEEHRLTVFEFFLTDLAAHRGSEEEQRDVLEKLDRFLAAIERSWPAPGRILALISDHGNIEDARTRKHTLNPVPLVVLGGGERGDPMRGVADLTDFAPALLDVLTRKARP